MSVIERYENEIARLQRQIDLAFNALPEDPAAARKALTEARWGDGYPDTPRGAVGECEQLRRRLVAEMCLTRTREEMLEDFGPDYERHLGGQ